LEVGRIKNGNNNTKENMTISDIREWMKATFVSSEEFCGKKIEFGTIAGDQKTLEWVYGLKKPRIVCEHCCLKNESVVFGLYKIICNTKGDAEKLFEIIDNVFNGTREEKLTRILKDE